MRFYLLNESDHIVDVRIEECDHAKARERATTFLNDAAPTILAVEAWDRSQFILRIERGSFFFDLPLGLAA